MTRYIAGKGGIPLKIDVSGATTDSYVTIVDQDLQGVESVTYTVKNTHGSNGITVAAVEEYADYSAGEENPLTGFPANITAGNKGRIQIEHANARLLIKVKNQTGGNNASYTIKGVVNKL